MKMKKLILGITLLTTSVYFMTSCSSSENDVEEGTIKVEYPSEEEDLYNFEAMSLQPYGINAYIYLPNESASIGASTSPEIFYELDGFEWEISVGQNFHLKIEDWGDEPFDNFIEELNKQKIYDIEYIEQKENYVYYKTRLNVRGKEHTEEMGVDHVSFHVAAMHTIDGINYVFRSKEEGQSERVINYMKETVKHVRQLEL